MQGLTQKRQGESKHDEKDAEDIHRGADGASPALTLGVDLDALGMHLELAVVIGASQVIHPAR